MKFPNKEYQTLDWLSSLVNYDFKHNFSDRWILVNIWDNILSISFDFRQSNQKELFELLPDKYKGCKQYRTGKLVNKKTLYFTLSDLFKIEYPDIVSSELIKTTKHQSGSGGWIDVGEFFYTYDWLVHLSDNTTIDYNNQTNKMDMVKGDYIYNCRIQEREFINFLNK